MVPGTCWGHFAETNFDEIFKRSTYYFLVRYSSEEGLSQLLGKKPLLLSMTHHTFTERERGQHELAANIDNMERRRWCAFMRLPASTVQILLL